MVAQRGLAVICQIMTCDSVTETAAEERRGLKETAAGSLGVAWRPQFASLAGGMNILRASMMSKGDKKSLRVANQVGIHQSGQFGEFVIQARPLASYFR